MISRNCKRMARMLPMALVALAAAAVTADDAELQKEPNAELGYHLLITKPMAGGFAKVEDLDKLWQVWEPELRDKAEKATPEERRRMTFERYGLIPRPDGDTTGLPLGYLDDGEGNLVTNCFSCHGGKVEGKTIPGVGNSHTDMTTMMTDGIKLSRLERGQDFSTVKDVKLPYNTPANFSKGFTNATIFSPILAAMRDEHLELTSPRNPGVLMHNDMDAPPWWNFKKKTMIYCDAFAPNSTRTLMQFAMSPTITGEQLRGFEPAFQHIRKYIDTLEPPKYTGKVDAKLASEGRELFEITCAKCHGTYGEGGEFPNKIVPIAEIGTDRVRFDALRKFDLPTYNKSWFSDYGKHPVILDAVGYLAQPLDGIWASGPYFHNGSSPTLYHVMNPSKRPKVWKRDENGYDHKRVGLNVEEFEAVPEGLNSREQRTYYDTATVSHSNGGHVYPDELNESEKWAVIEYLKTL